MDDAELARMRRKVDRGEPLVLDLEAGALITEMMRATAAFKPAATTLNAAVGAAQERLGRELSFDEIERLWNEDAGLRAVKQLHDRERARWRRANGILRESNLLIRGEGVPLAPALAAAAAEPIAPEPIAPEPVAPDSVAAEPSEPDDEEGFDDADRRGLLRRTRSLRRPHGGSGPAA